MSRPAYPSEVTDQEWDFVVPSLTLMKEDAPPREYPLRELFSARRGFVRAGGPWRMRPNDLPPWTAVEQQAKGWMRAGCFEAMAHDLRMVIRLLQEKAEQPSAVILDGRTLQSSPPPGFSRSCRRSATWPARRGAAFSTRRACATRAGAPIGPQHLTSNGLYYTRTFTRLSAKLSYANSRIPSFNAFVGIVTYPDRRLEETASDFGTDANGTEIIGVSPKPLVNFQGGIIYAF